jgi:hypothetical protein
MDLEAIKKKYEETRNENIGLKKVQNLQGI